jgi:hypothetical protein
MTAIKRKEKNGLETERRWNHGWRPVEPDSGTAADMVTGGMDTLRWQDGMATTGMEEEP